MNHKDLKVWKISIDLVIKIYDLSKNLPQEEKFGLISQIRRASISIPSNIAEGAARRSTKEYMRFLDIANGSLSELETQLIIIEKLDYFETSELIDSRVTVIRKMIYRLKESLNKKL